MLRNLFKKKIKFDKKISKKIEELKKENFVSMTPKNMLDMFLEHYKELNKKLTNVQYIEILNKCNEFDYNRKDLDSDGYPLDLEREIIDCLQNYAINKLGYNENYVDYNGLN